MSERCLTQRTQGRLFGDGSEPCVVRTGLDPPIVPHSGPVTSRAAAVSVVDRVSDQKTLVFQFLIARGDVGATDVEIQTGLNLTGDSERPRRWSLQRSGLVIDSGKRRPAPSGRLVIVWVARAN